MLRPEPGHEEDTQYWLASLSVNRAIMRALDASDQAADCAPKRHDAFRSSRDPKPDRNTRIC